jgi:hypothetical protein
VDRGPTVFDRGDMDVDADGSGKLRRPGVGAHGGFDRVL